MSAYNSESALARLLRPHYSCGDNESRALLARRSPCPVTCRIIGNTLHVRLDPARAPRRSNALAALCIDLNDTATRYPGTDLTLAYSVRDPRSLMNELSMSRGLGSCRSDEDVQHAAGRGDLFDRQGLVGGQAWARPGKFSTATSATIRMSNRGIPRRPASRSRASASKSACVV